MGVNNILIMKLEGRFTVLFQIGEMRKDTNISASLNPEAHASATTSQPGFFSVLFLSVIASTHFLLFTRLGRK